MKKIKRGKAKIRFDEEANAMYIQVVPGKYPRNSQNKTIEIPVYGNNNIILMDLDKDGNVLGIEILFKASL